MQKRRDKSWKSAVILMAPVLLLIAFALKLQFTQPAELRAAEVRFKRLPTRVINSTPLSPAWVPVQILVFIDYPKNAKPAWWGDPMLLGQENVPFCQGSNGQRSGATWSLNSCTFDGKQQQYRAAIYFYVKDAPQWTQGGMFHIDLKLLRQDGKTRGVLPINTPMRL